MLEKILKKLIKTTTGRWRRVATITGLGIAMILILSAAQLQVNYNSLLYGKSNKDSIANFLVVNKDLSANINGNTTFAEAEIADLRKQSFVDAAGIITSSRFKISIDGGTVLPFRTDLFFESVPDQFLDIESPDWIWNDNSAFIPIVIPNMFLDLYNFGFATSQNTPQLSQELIRQIPLQISIYTAAGTVQYPAKVVGFSDRISSILVPQNFMDWANEKFGQGRDIAASRMVIKTTDAANPELTKYLSEHHLKTDNEKTRFSRYRQIVNFVVNISWVTGAAMLLFAIIIFSLFIELSIMSAKEETRLLITLGTAPRQLKTFLLKQFFPVNIFITLLVLGIVSGLQFALHLFLKKQHMHISPLLSAYTIGAALLILVVLFLVNRSTINKVAR